MNVIHIILMAPYIQTNNEELYLYNNDVTYYVITCNSAFNYNNDVTYYVITRNYQWTPDEILTNNLLEAGCTSKLCPFQYKYDTCTATHEAVAIYHKQRLTSQKVYTKH